jgi:hypothetical protein
MSRAQVTHAIPSVAAYVSIRQHTSAYVSIRQHSHAYGWSSIENQSMSSSIEKQCMSWAQVKHLIPYRKMTETVWVTHALQTRCKCFTCFTSACVALTCTCVRQSTQQKKMFFDNLYTKKHRRIFIFFRAKLQRTRRCIEQEQKKKMMETKTGRRPKWTECSKLKEEFFSTSSMSNTT